MIFRSQDLKHLLDLHGQSLTFTVKGSPTYNPTTGDVSRSDTDYTVKGYFYNYNLGDLNGVDVLLGDRRLVFPIVDTSEVTIPEPDPGDEVAGEGDKVTIVSVSKIMSGSTPVCYVCQVRE